MAWSRRLRALAAVRRPRLAGWRSRQVSVIAGSCVAVAAFGGFGAYLAQDRAGTTGNGSGARSGPVGAQSGLAGPGLGGPGGPGGAPTGSLPAAGPAGADGTIKSKFATIVAPRAGRPAPRCTVVEGTSNLPAGQTLLTAVENLEVGDGVRHLQVVQGWDNPKALHRWTGRQFIGLPRDAVGGRFRIEVIMAPLASLKLQISETGGEHGPWRARYPADARVVASAVVTRAPGHDPPGCPVPPA